MGEWKTTALDSLCELIADCPHSTPVWTTNGVIVLRSQNIRGGRLDLSSPSYTDEEHFQDRIRRAEPTAGDLVITREAPMGEVCQIPSGLRCCLGQRMVLLRPDRSQADGRYLLFALQSRAVQTQIMWAEGTGSTVSNLRIPDLKKLKIPSPSLPEQRAIAYILGTLDDKIELNRRRNQTLEAMARALFKDWFVDFGPVRANRTGTACRALTPAPHLPADLWRLFPDRLDDEGKPEGWSERPLDEIADFLNGLALQKFPATDPDDSLPVIKIAELRNGVSAKSDRASREVPAKYVIKDGDFLFSWSGSLLAKFWTEGEGALNQHLFKVTSERYPMWFVSHWVHHHLEEFQAIAASKATTMGHIQRGHLKAAMTICPPDNVVGRIGIVRARRAVPLPPVNCASPTPKNS